LPRPDPRFCASWVSSSMCMCVDTNPMISAASRGESAPAAQEARTADDALSASATLSIFGKSNVIDRSRRGGKMRSRQGALNCPQRTARLRGHLFLGGPRSTPRQTSEFSKFWRVSPRRPIVRSHGGPLIMPEATVEAPRLVSRWCPSSKGTPGAPSRREGPRFRAPVPGGRKRRAARRRRRDLGKGTPRGFAPE
jgi:hypothetical protein